MEPVSDDEYYTAIEHCSGFSTLARTEESDTSQQTVDQTLIRSQESGTRQNGHKKKMPLGFRCKTQICYNP